MKDVLIKQVSSLYRQFLEEWNTKNATGMAALFTEHAPYIGFDGSKVTGRAEIAAIFTQIFDDFPTGTYVAIIKDVNIISDNAAVLTAVTGVVPRGETDISPAVNAVQSITATLADGEWKIALLQSTPAAFHGRPEMCEQLSADLRLALSILTNNN